MVRKKFHKLVRDRIPEIIRTNGEEAVTKKLLKKEFRTALKEKLLEESLEVAQASHKGALLKELADVHEVLRAIMVEWKLTTKDVGRVRKERLKKRGGFVKKIFLIETK